MNSKKRVASSGSSERPARPLKLSRSLKTSLRPDSVESSASRSARCGEKLEVRFDAHQMVESSQMSGDQDSHPRSNQTRFRPSQVQVSLDEHDQDLENPRLVEDSDNSDSSYKASQGCSDEESETNNETAKSSAQANFLARILDNQKKVLDERRSFISPHMSRKKKTASKKETVLQRAARAGSIKERWQIYVDTLDNKFFSSAEARLQNTSRVRKGKIAYQGLSVSEKNSEDMKSMFNVGWQAKVSLGQPITTYDQVRVVIGQFARFCVAASLCDVADLWKEGALFNLSCSMDASRAFLNYFQIRGAAGTVMCKAMHLKTMAHYADSHFAKNGAVKNRGMLSAISEYLTSVSRANKTESRRQAANSKVRGGKNNVG